MHHQLSKKVFFLKKIKKIILGVFTIHLLNNKNEKLLIFLEFPISYYLIDRHVGDKHNTTVCIMTIAILGKNLLLSEIR